MTYRFSSISGMFVRFISLVILALATPLRVGELTASSPIVGLVEPSAQEGPARYGMERLREALAARGFRVASVSSRIRPDFVVVAGTTADCEAGRLLREAN